MWPLVRRVPPRWRAAVGLLTLLTASWVAMYGRLWTFEGFEEHRFTARAMLTGTLRLTGALSHVNGDEQVYNGAGYTNWGFGVPLLQIPFHAAAGALGLLHGFFPDRAIYFTYLAASIPVIWVALDQLLAMRPGPQISRMERGVLSWVATWLVLARTVFPLMSTRFVVYESTMAYFVIAQLLVISAYVFFLRSHSRSAALAMGIAAGMGLLIRPTGLLYLGMWTGTIALERRSRGRLWSFAMGCVPLAAFWMYSNYVRSGSPLALGFRNTNPALPYHTPMERFGSQCCDTPLHAVATTMRLFSGFFLFVAKRLSVQWLNDCHFHWEERDDFFPFFGPLFLVLLAWMLYRLVRRREILLPLYLPYLGMALLFVSFVHRGQGFAWRYAHDFWPAIVLAVMQYIHTQPQPATRRTDLAVGRAMFAYGFFVFAWFLVPWQWTKRPVVFPANDTAAMEARFLADRWATPDAVDSKVSCADELPPLYHDGLGWGQTERMSGACTSVDELPVLVRERPPFVRCDLPPCAVGTFTNLFVGVPSKVTNSYRLVIHTEGIEAPSLPVYVNGGIFRAPAIDGGHYEAEVQISYEELHTRAVLVTVKWTDHSYPFAAKLLSVELV